MIAAERAVLVPRFVADCSALAWLCPRECSCPSGGWPDSCHGRRFPARCTSSRLTAHSAAMTTDSGVIRHAITSPGSGVPATTTARMAMTARPSSTSTSEAAR